MKKAAIELSTTTIIVVGLSVILFIFLVLFLTTYFPKATQFLMDIHSSIVPNASEIDVT